MEEENINILPKNNNSDSKAMNTDNIIKNHAIMFILLYEYFNLFTCIPRDTICTEPTLKAIGADL